MAHLSHLSLAQQTLIVLGALFQMGAYYIFSKECAHARQIETTQKRRVQAKLESEAARKVTANRQLAAQPVLAKIVKYRRHVEGEMEQTPEDVRPADLLRTAKVRFKHSLEAYQGETQSMPSIRREASPPGR